MKQQFYRITEHLCSGELLSENILKNSCSENYFNLSSSLDEHVVLHTCLCRVMSLEQEVRGDLDICVLNLKIV